MTEGLNGRLRGQVAIVTGGGSGIGRATCVALAREGVRAVVVDRDAEGVKTTIGLVEPLSPGLPPLGLVLDVSREQDMEEMAQRTLAHFGRFEILVASAGILRKSGTSPKLLAELPVEEWDVILTTNLTGLFLSNRAVLPSMIAQRSGQIINISSTAGQKGRALDAAYCASKFGVVGLSEALAEEVRQYGIRVHVILPDAVDTPLWEQNKPIPRPGNALPADRVAEFIVYLLALPQDTILFNPVIVPFRSNRRHAKSGLLGTL
jgi:NAD(P)-dependent dehydrogenase (short-subunit alcohol dehydrogenase family)